MADQRVERREATEEEKANTEAGKEEPRYPIKSVTIAARAHVKSMCRKLEKEMDELRAKNGIVKGAKSGGKGGAGPSPPSGKVQLEPDAIAHDVPEPPEPVALNCREPTLRVRSRLHSLRQRDEVHLPPTKPIGRDLEATTSGPPAVVDAHQVTRLRVFSQIGANEAPVVAIDPHAVRRIGLPKDATPNKRVELAVRPSTRLIVREGRRAVQLRTGEDVGEDVNHERCPTCGGISSRSDRGDRP